MKHSQLTIAVVVVSFVILGFLGFSMMKPASQEETSMAPVETSEMQEQMPFAGDTIVDVAVGNGNFETLVAAVTAAGLVDTLSGAGPFTVFAPTDEAFAKLPAGTIEGLLEDKEALIKVLTYHVVSGKVMAEDVGAMTSATSLQGQDIAIAVEGSTVMINDATVLQADIEASNGVIHVIDTVLLPE